jgi:hypothetical protein
MEYAPEAPVNWLYWEDAASLSAAAGDWRSGVDLLQSSFAEPA